MADCAAAEVVPRPSDPQTARRLLRSRGLWMIVTVAGFGWLVVEGLDRMGGPAEIRATYGWRLAGPAVIAQALVSVSPLPGEAIAFTSSAVHGFWLGAGLNWLGWMLAAFLECGLVRWTARDVAFSEEKLPRWLRRFPVDHPVFLIVARFLPLGSHLVNGIAGLRGVAIWRFTWTSAIALIPGALLISAIANGWIGGS